MIGLVTVTSLECLYPRGSSCKQRGNPHVIKISDSQLKSSVDSLLKK